MNPVADRPCAVITSVFDLGELDPVENEFAPPAAPRQFSVTDRSPGRDRKALADGDASSWLGRPDGRLVLGGTASVAQAGPRRVCQEA